MKTTFINCLVVLCVATTAFVSCESTSNEDLSPTQSAEPTQEMTVLGKKLANPHAPEVVRQAFESVQKSNPEIAQNVHMDFNPTHMYVKFFPKDVTQLNELQQLYGFELDNIPAFYEFETLGDYYHDPTVAAGMPTYQYTTLPVDTKLPSSINYEIVEQLILIDDSEQINNTPKYNEDFVLALQQEQYKLTGLTDLAVDFFTKVSRWTPGGVLREWPSNGNPIVGAQIRLHDFVFIPVPNSRMNSDRNGAYRLGRRIRHKVFYRVNIRPNATFYCENCTHTSRFIKRDYNIYADGTQFTP